jgi:tetraacyldisaccharide 4'-kinase
MMKRFQSIEVIVSKYLYAPLNIFTFFLLPLSWLFCVIVWCRRFLYQCGLKKVTHFPVPIIVVGNITIGGTGKTPLVIWLAQALMEKGYCPGIVSRGYGVKKIVSPRLVEANSDVETVGDEAVLIARRLPDCPLVVCANRVAAVQFLLATHYCDIVLSDDGLQHYALGRDIEIVVVDGERGLGNELCLPVGPLREPLSRLSQVDFIVYHHSDLILDHHNVVGMKLHSGTLTSVANFRDTLDARTLEGKTIHAVAGIGYPQRFFDMLKNLALGSIKKHPFKDHHLFQKKDLDFNDQTIVIMTEKDAVKCQSFADRRHWFLPVTACLASTFVDRIVERIEEIKK